MSIPLECATCGQVIGEESAEATLCRTHFDSSVEVECPGRGNHQEPVRTETERLFGFLTHVHLEYPETRTESSWGIYSGPPNLVALWFAIVFGSGRYPNGNYRGVTVNGKWVWWELKIGFYGAGLAELQKMQAAQGA